MASAKATPKAEETSLRILDSALALFREEGFDAATMRDIAARAGVATGAAYYYYPSKDAIVMAFYQRSCEEMQPRIAAALKGAAGLSARLHELIRVKLEYFAPNRAVLRALLRNGADPEAVRSRLEGMAGSSGFMLFRTSDHGALLRLAGQTKMAVQYLLGNPLFAVRMTQHDIRASLYAPLRVLVYEDEGGKTCVEYDRPSSLFGQFGNTGVSEVATMLDRKLEQLVTEATR